jgi:hypothetical protein
MATLTPAHRRLLERAVKDARIAAEGAVREEIGRLGVAADAAPEHVRRDPALAALRRRLREHARAVGDKVTTDSKLDHLVEASAYLRWHRLLFVAFLDARELLRHPDGDVLTLDDCRDLAAEEGAADGWGLAARYAARILPAAFAEDDPSVALILAPEHEASLRRIVGGLPREVFAAADALGWTYQYWRAAEKDAINARGVKIGADELPAVTQLFTEPYMVRFLIDNTLGAWWAGKRFADDPALADALDEVTLRERLALPGADWAWLRFVREDEGGPWRPAAGTFPGWPRAAAAITLLDPCCGSGHFLTEALPILVALRQAQDDTLDAAGAVAGVLNDNLHGLEIDGRCVQIASFAVALSAWAVGGWQSLPNPHIAWVGSAPAYTRAEFEGLGNGDAGLRRSLGALHDLFAHAPLLGSLIEVTRSLDLVDRANLDGIGTAMARLTERTREREPDRAEGAIAARGMADAAAILARDWVLQLTNVPFLGRTRFSEMLARHLRDKYPRSSGNVATAMIERMSRNASAGTVAFVSPQNWYLQPTYSKFRQALCSNVSLSLVAPLGPGAFDSIGGEQVVVGLTIANSSRSPIYNVVSVEGRGDPDAKAQGLIEESLVPVPAPVAAGFRVLLEPLSALPPLSKYADFHKGLCLGDDGAFRLAYWELGSVDQRWSYIQSSPDRTALFGGMTDVFLWEGGKGRLTNYVRERLNGSTGAWIRGLDAWGGSGVTIQCMGSLPASLYGGHGFDSNVATITFKDHVSSAAVWSYLESDSYRVELRKINKEMKVGDASIVGVPFDLAHWTAIAAEHYPDGLPEPYSNDPTQWLFHGHPAQSETGTALHVALARICGYRWPAESDPEMRLSKEARDCILRVADLPPGDADGLLPLVACGGEAPLAERLRGYARAAFGDAWNADLETRLVEEADTKLGCTTKRSLATIDDWLRTRAFAQHAKLFHQRPFLWHVWDGRDDGFGAFAHYHRFDRAGLEKLTFTLIGDWITRSDADDDTGRSESSRALQTRLRAVLDGETPYDIFVRWKSLAQQPIGWDPDLDDGVRMNIRPFIEAGVLRARLNVHWRKDRGTDVASAPWFPVHKGERINDYHTTLAEKRAARDTTG